MTRHTYRYLIVVVVILVLTAGCSSLLGGDGPISFSAEKAEVPDATLSDEGYEEEQSRSVELNRTVTLQDEERRLEITNQLEVYQQTVLDQAVAFVVVFSTPKAEVLNQPLNPLGTMDEETLLKRIASERNEVSDLEKTGSFDITILDSDATVSTYDATAQVNGEETDVTLHITRVDHEDDFIIAVGGYPDGYDGEEEISRLMASIEHPV